MKFMMLYRPADPNAEKGRMPDPKYLERMNAYIAESMRTGALLATGGLMPSAHGAIVRRTDGRFTVVDGPFSEAKEVIGGYAIMEFATKAEAVESSKRSAARSVPTQFRRLSLPATQLPRDRKKPTGPESPHSTRRSPRCNRRRSSI